MSSDETTTPSGTATSRGSRRQAVRASAPGAELGPDDRAKLDELAAALDGFSLDEVAPTASAPAVEPPVEPALTAGPPVEVPLTAPPVEPVIPPEAPAFLEALPPTPAIEPPPLPIPEPPPPPAVFHPTPVSQPSFETVTMIPWIETKQFTVDLFPTWTKTEGDKEWSLGAVTVDVPEITAKLDQLIASLNEDQWEIKMVVPLDKSLTYHEHQKVVRSGSRKEPEAVLGAFGLGWAGGTTSSLLVVCQRTEWLDPADYKARIGARNDKLVGEQRQRDRAAALQHNVVVNGKITAAQRVLDDLVTNGVKTKKSGFLRGEKFVVDGAEFTNRTEAESALRARIGELEADLAALPKQLRPVEG